MTNNVNPKTNSNKIQTKQRNLDQPTISRDHMLFHHRTSRFSPTSCTFHRGKNKDNWFLQCVISTLHHRPMFSTNCMWVCVYMSRAYRYIYVCMYVCMYVFLIAYVKIFKSVCFKTKPTKKKNPNPKIILFMVVCL
jgi:hypothetical protein